MNSHEKQDLYNKAWNFYGPEHQIDILIEECAELTQALLKARRNGVTYSYAVSEEIADVIICLEQIQSRLSKCLKHDSKETLWDQVRDIKEVKLKRLKERLASDIAKHESRERANGNTG